MSIKQWIAAACFCIAGLFLTTPRVIAGEKPEEHRHDHGHEGSRQDLGTTEAGGLKITATQVGKVEAGKEAVFEVVVPKDAKAPKAIRLWVGGASAEGSTKAKAENDGEDFEAHVEVPKPLPHETRLWVELQPESGARIKVSFELKK